MIRQYFSVKLIGGVHLNILSVRNHCCSKALISGMCRPKSPQNYFFLVSLILLWHSRSGCGNVLSVAVKHEAQI